MTEVMSNNNIHTQPQLHRSASDGDVHAHNNHFGSSTDFLQPLRGDEPGTLSSLPHVKRARSLSSLEILADNKGSAVHPSSVWQSSGQLTIDQQQQSQMLQLQQQMQMQGHSPSPGLTNLSILVPHGSASGAKSPMAVSGKTQVSSHVGGEANGSVIPSDTHQVAWSESTSSRSTSNEGNNLVGDDMDDGDGENDGQPIKENSGRWTHEEHCLFLKGLESHGKAWKCIAGLIKTRTVVQIRTHAQKYFQKLAKAKENGDLMMDPKSGKRKGKGGKRKLDLYKSDASLAPSLQPFVQDAGAVESGLYHFLSPVAIDDTSMRSGSAVGGTGGGRSMSMSDPRGSGLTRSSSTPLMGTAGGLLAPVPQQPHMLSLPQWFQHGTDVCVLLHDAEVLDWGADHGGGVIPGGDYSHKGILTAAQSAGNNSVAWSEGTGATPVSPPTPPEPIPLPSSSVVSVSKGSAASSPSTSSTATVIVSHSQINGSLGGSYQLADGEVGESGSGSDSETMGMFDMDIGAVGYDDDAGFEDAGDEMDDDTFVSQLLEVGEDRGGGASPIPVELGPRD